MNRAAILLKIQTGEGKLVVLATSMMFAANFGGAIGSPGVEALFYSRFGVEFLPYMYIILGLVSPLTSILMTALMARVQVSRLYLVLPVVMAFLIIGARLLLEANLTWIYAVLWLGMNIFWILQSLFSWGSAGLVTDTRQAKRLFPLFGVGGIVGLALGSLATRPLVTQLGTENLLLFWSLGLLAAFILELRLISRARIRSRPTYDKKEQGILKELRNSYQTVRSSSLLRWMALAAVLFAVLYYSIVFPFASAVANEFPDEDSVAAFLGTFQGIATAVAVTASLFFANRLYGRFGFMTTILVYPIIYLVGFTITAATASFTVLILFRFVQIFWSEGVSEGANQAMYNVVPPEKRESARTFIRGVANQFGVSLAGVVLLLGDRVLSDQYLYIIGAGLGAVTTYFVWQARRSYGSAVVAALRAGQSHLFFSDEEPFGGFRQDAKAVATAVAGIHSPEVAVRRVSADILGRLSLSEATDAIVASLDDEDPSVRAALLRALGAAGASEALLEAAVLLKDPEPEVRQEAINTITVLAGYPKGIATYLEPLLEDEDTAVRCRAAAGLLQMGDHAQANAMLEDLAAASPDTASDNANQISDRILALEALAEVGGADNYEIAAAGLEDPSPRIRSTSARLIANIDPELCLYPLKLALGDDDEYVRQSAAEALGNIGAPALDMVLASLDNPQQEQGALLALQYLPVKRPSEKLQIYMERQAEEAVHYHDLWHQCLGFQIHYLEDQTDAGQLAEYRQLNQRNSLLAGSLQETARQHGQNALWAMGLAGNREGVFLAIDNLSSPSASQRANALETLESVGESTIVRSLVPLWETADISHDDPGVRWLQAVFQDRDSWIRACGVLMGSILLISHPRPMESAKMKDDLRSMENAMRELAESDPDPLVRDSIGLTLNGEKTMDTLDTLSTMEKVLFLQQVPLFASLPPKDLMQIASVTGERAFSDGAIIAEQGETGDVLYIIVDGEVMVTTIGDDDSQAELGRRQPGEYVGEMAIISDEVRMARLTALGEVRTLCINRTEFREILHHRPEASQAVIDTLSMRLRELSQSKPG